MTRLAVTVAFVVAIAACGGDGSAEELRVFAAASLTEAFTSVGRAFEAAHPEVDVVVDFGASSTLAQQIVQGAPADVFVSADDVSMRTAREHVGEAVVVARNRLALAVEEGNPAGIRSLADLERPGLVFVTCAVSVPCGRLAERALARAGLDAAPASREQDVKAVVAKVALGEADAGVVYATDVRDRDGIEGVPLDIADARDLQATYPMAVTRTAGDPDLARAFVDFVAEGGGRRILRDHGFLAP